MLHFRARHTSTLFDLSARNCAKGEFPNGWGGYNSLPIFPFGERASDNGGSKTNQTTSKKRIEERGTGNGEQLKKDHPEGFHANCDHTGSIGLYR